MKSFTLVVSATLLATATADMDIGDRLLRTFTEYVKLPITATDATGSGWAQMTGATCDPRYGIPFVNSTVGLGRHDPTVLYFTKDGAVSGVSVDVFGQAPPANLVQKGFFEKIQDDRYRIGVSFRESPCETPAAGALGDRVVLAPGAAAWELPLTKQAAVDGKWKSGSCFAGMGTHYFYDVETAPQMSWNASNLLPVVTMFNNEDDLQAIFFASSIVQQQGNVTNNWEPQALPNPYFCANMCDPACTFSGTSVWSTYHLYFRDLSLSSCPNDCKMACCPP